MSRTAWAADAHDSLLLGFTSQRAWAADTHDACLLAFWALCAKPAGLYVPKGYSGLWALRPKEPWRLMLMMLAPWASTRALRAKGQRPGRLMLMMLACWDLRAKGLGGR